jgi:putative flippase GtrA
LFALIAIIVNIATQELSLYLYAGAHAVVASILAGTATGLVTKYVLDRNFIFRYRAKTLDDDLRKFVAYTATGVATTLVFWGFEMGFEWAFASKLARYVGAVIGLTIGYLVKYQLDKRWVFVSPHACST